MQRWLESVALLGTLLIASLTHAQTLDNFEEGAFSLSTLPGANFDDATQSGLSTSNVLSGERVVLLDFIGSTSSPGPSTATLSLTGGDDAASFTAGSELGKRPETIYLFSSPVDLTASGSSFSIDLDALSDPAGAFSILVGVESNGGFNESSVGVSGLSPGTITIPFSSLTGMADVSQADSVFLQLRTTDGAIGSVSATIDDFQIIPDGPSVPMLGLGSTAIMSALLVASALIVLRQRTSSEPLT